MTEPAPSVGAWRRFARNRPAWASFWFLGGIGLFVAVWPFVSAYDLAVVSEARFQSPSLQHWCGTDVHGRDLLARMAAGGRVSLLVGLVGALLSLVIGVSWGTVAGYAGGRWDNCLMRVVDVLYSIPTFLFVLVFIAVMEMTFPARASDPSDTLPTLDPRSIFMVIGLGAISWLTMARVVRGQVLALRGQSFIEASRALGAGHARILWRHVLPHVSGVVIVYLTLTIPGIILYESFLSFLGLGIQPPMASWGSLIADGAHQLNPIRIYWWLIVCPAVLMVLTLLALNFVGDGLRDAFAAERAE